MPPKLYKKMKDVCGDATVFLHTVEGSAPLSVQWQRDENWILEDPTIETAFDNHESTLMFPSCEATHSRTGICQFVNEAGHDKCFATLEVQGTSASGLILLINIRAHSVSNTCTHLFFLVF